MMKLARIAYQDAGHREGHAVQVRLTEYFIDALNNSFIKDVVWANPESLSEALTVARDSERLFQRLNPPQGFNWGNARRSREELSSGKTHNHIYQPLHSGRI